MGTRRLAIALVLLLTTVAAARQPAARPAGEVVIHSIVVDALKNNLLGDPAQRNVAVYLPPTYKTSATRRYPTVYLLHGYLSNLQAFGTREGIPGYQGMQLATLMDGLIATATSKEMIVVVPNGRNAYFGSFYTNSPVTGGWEDFVARELVRWVDGNFRTIAAAESRGIAGHSMGGYGAIMLGMKHPDVFGAFYALSPCCVGLEGDLGPENQAWVAAAQVRTRSQLQPRPQSPEEFYTSAFIALSAAFSPNPAKPELYIDLPFEPNDGRMVPKDAIIAAWRSKMPLYVVDEYPTESGAAARNLLGLRCAGRVLAHSNHDACVFHRVGEPRYRAHVRGLFGREPREQDPRASRNPGLPLLFRGSASSLSLVRVTFEPWRSGLPLG